MGSGAIYLSIYLSACLPCYLSGGVAHDVVSDQQAEHLRYGVEIDEPVVAVQPAAVVSDIVELCLLQDPVQISLLAGAIAS
jgi:hypothetical protein